MRIGKGFILFTKRTLIRGRAGQDGPCLAEIFERANHYVRVTHYTSTVYECIEHLFDRVKIVSGELLDQGFKTAGPLRRAAGRHLQFCGAIVRVDVVDAAVSNGGFAALGVTHSFDTVRAFAATIRFYQASCSETFDAMCHLASRIARPIHAFIAADAKVSVKGSTSRLFAFCGIGRVAPAVAAR